MAETAKKRLSIRVMALTALLIGLPLALLGIHGTIKYVELRQWAAMRHWCQAAAQEARSRDSHRPVLRGVPTEGNSWDDYHVALASLGPKNIDLLWKVHSQNPSAEPAKVRALCKEYAPALQAFRHGTSRACAQPRTDWEHRYETPYSLVNHLALLASCQARFMLEDGHPREAMELLLDIAHFSEDMAFNGNLMDGYFALSTLMTAMDGLKDLVSRKVLSTEDYQELSRELELLDQGFPSETKGLALESMTLGFEFLQSGNLTTVLQSHEFRDPIQAPWCYGFSDQLVLVNYFQSSISWNRQLMKAAELPWNEAKAVQLEVEQEQTASRNPLVQKFEVIRSNLRSPIPENIFRERRAQLRLIRSLAAYRTNGEIPTLDDPLGAKLHSSIDGSLLKLWSVGRDGIDDHGTGEWHTKRGDDIVLIVER